MPSKPIQLACLLLSVVAAGPAAAKLYSYENENGDYVISKQRPKNVGEYAVLTNEGEFIELVHPPALDVPITHWRPWYLPPEPNAFAGPEPAELAEPAEPSITIEEVDAGKVDGKAEDEASDDPKVDDPAQE